MCRLVTSLVTVYLIDSDPVRRARLERSLARFATSVVSLSNTLDLPCPGSIQQPACIVVALDAPGLPILEFIGRTHSTCPVVVIGATVDLHRVVDVIRAGASNFLDRPGDDRRLRAAVREAIRDLTV